MCLGLLAGADTAGGQRGQRPPLNTLLPPLKFLPPGQLPGGAKNFIGALPVSNAFLKKNNQYFKETF